MKYKQNKMLTLKEFTNKIIDKGNSGMPGYFKVPGREEILAEIKEIYEGFYSEIDFRKRADFAGKHNGTYNVFYDGAGTGDFYGEDFGSLQGCTEEDFEAIRKETPEFFENNEFIEALGSNDEIKDYISYGGDEMLASFLDIEDSASVKFGSDYEVKETLKAVKEDIKEDLCALEVVGDIMQGDFMGLHHTNTYRNLYEEIRFAITGEKHG